MSSKRKASSATTPVVDQGDNQALKKRKPTLKDETPEETTRVGLAFLDQIKMTRDKRNKLIATHFYTLPDRRQVPDYYYTIGLPMALDTIEAKLNRREYPTMTTLECDLRRMVSNAKSYNDKSSEFFSDAEKIRKLVVSYMSQNNPAYATGNYQPYSTPVPVGWRDRLQMPEEPQDLDAEGETDPDEPGQAIQPISNTVAELPARRSARRESSTPAVQDAEGAGESFDGNSFQQAQEKIMTELINLKNEEDQIISTPFINLPSRDLRDYYRIIKHPVCLKGAQKAVRGIKGREKPTGTTFLKSWQAFQDEVSRIWNNAREYNEDGSDISLLAGQLESYFNRRLAEAKRVVPEPPQPKVKLRMSARSPEPPKITLRFGGQKPSGTGVSIDSEALKRQQEMVKAGANGQGHMVNNTNARNGSRNPFGRSPSISGSTQIPSLHTTSQDRARSASAEQPNGVKSEVPLGQSPALGAVQLNRELNRSSESGYSPNPNTTIMPPPSNVTPRLSSQSPHPQAALTNSHLWNAQSGTTFLDSRWRQPGKDATDALILNLSISTHPNLNLEHHFHLDIPPSPTASQQSVTISLPKTHHHLRIMPTIANHVMHRPNKLIATLGNQRLNTVPRRAEEYDQRRPLYEARLSEGVNRIEMEMIAGPPRGASKTGSGQEIELEKITVFVNIAKT